MGPSDMGKALNDFVSGTHGSDPLGKVTETVTDGGSSLVHLMMTVGCVAVTIALIIAGLKIASMNRNTREEGKQKLLAVVVAATVLFGLMSVLLLVSGIADVFMKS